MPFEGFLHPLLLWGLAGAAVPVLIHLFNRRRYRRLSWAAMDFLLAAYRRTRRRMRLENFLLLLARCAAVSLLALAVARPFASAAGALGQLTERRRDQVVVLDASYSMGFREGGTTPFERAIDVAREIVDRARPERGDKIRLVQAKTRPEEIPGATKDDLLRALETLASSGPSQEGSDFRQTLAFLERVVEGLGPGGSVVVTFLSDLQRLSFASAEEGKAAATGDADAKEEEGGGKEPGDEAIRAMLASLHERGAAFHVLDVGPPMAAPPNAGIVSLGPDPADQGFFAGSPITLQAVIRNHGSEDRTGGLVRFLVDGNPRNATRVDLPPQSERIVPFAETFSEPGSHTVEAVLEADALGADDRRAFAIEVRAPLRILLVEPEPNDDPTLTESGYLRMALEPTEGSGPMDLPPFLPTVVDRSVFHIHPENLPDYDAVVLANVESVSPDMIERCRAYVEGGGALIVFLGDAVDQGTYNARLSDPETGVLPARLVERKRWPDPREGFYRVVLRDPLHAAFRFFAEDPLYRPLLTEAPFYEFWFLEPHAGEDVKVPAVFDDPAGPPFLVERTLGRGRIFLLAVPANDAWSPFMSRWVLVPFAFDLFRAATARPVGERNRSVRETLRLEVDRPPLRMWWEDALGRRAPISGTPRPLGPDRWLVPEIEETGRAGVYAIELETAGRLGSTETSIARFAVNVDPREGDLRRIDAPEVSLSEFFPGTRVEFKTDAESPEDSRSPEEQGEFWRTLAMAVLVFLLVESAIGLWVGRRRN